MKNTKKIIEDIIAALDGHTAATSEEAEQLLHSGYLPVDEFMKKVKDAAEKASEAENNEHDAPDINADKNNI